MTYLLLLVVALLLAAFAFVSGYFLGQKRKSSEEAAIRDDLKEVAADLVRRESTDLRRLHRDTLLELLDPLDRDLKDFHERMVTGNTELKTNIQALVSQTQSVGQQAEQLTRALQGNNKIQGNWGEGILKNVLSASGLEPGRDFEVQVHLPDGLVPDVIVHLPENRHLVVDSKVSLTAFIAYANAEDEDERRRLLRKHLDSVRTHVSELSAKHYEKRVAGAIGYVLMFIPHEAAYVAAVTADNNLSAEAYKRHVILVNPTNLLMALQLTENLWQSERQKKNVEQIYHSAERLYKKFVLFSENFQRIGQSIQSLHSTYDRALGQLAEGKGNIIHQLEDWKQKGLSTSENIPELKPPSSSSE